MDLMILGIHRSLGGFVKILTGHLRKLYYSTLLMGEIGLLSIVVGTQLIIKMQSIIIGHFMILQFHLQLARLRLNLDLLKCRLLLGHMIIGDLMML